MGIDLANIISAIGVIIAAWFSYNQYTRNKITDLKVDKYKRDEERRSYRRSESSAKVFGELWRILYALNADRVYVVQPHPMGHPMFLSVQFEVKRNAIEGMQEQIQNLHMSDVPAFSDMMASKDIMYITDVGDQVEDPVARSIMLSNGCESVIIKRLNSTSDWVGSIFCEYTKEISATEVAAQKELEEAALRIQYIIPESYKPKDGDKI